MENSTIDLVAAVEARAAFTIDARQLAAATAFMRKRIAHKLGRFEDSAGAIASASVRLTAHPSGEIVLEASRAGYVGATVTLQADCVDVPGAFVTSADTLDGAAQKLAKSSKGALARVQDGPGRAHISAGRARFGLVSRAAHTLHALPTAGEDGTLSAEFELPVAQFAADVKALAPAMGSEERRTHLHQIALQRRELAGRARFLMLATDGSNVAAASRSMPLGAEALPDCGIPSDAVPALVDLVKLGGGDAVAVRVEQGNGGELFTVTAGFASLSFFGAVETFPDIMRAVEGAMGEGEGQAPLFPDLLPGAPTGAMERLAKGAPGAVQWEHSGKVMVGACADPGLFLCAMRCDDGAAGKRGESYRGPNCETGEIVGPDGVTYPVPFKDSGAAIGFSAAQVRALIGESCFETIAVPLPAGHPLRTHFPVGTAYVARWLFEEGDSRLLCVKPDGRCYDYSAGGERAYLSRAEVEELLAEPVERQGPAQGAVATMTDDELRDMVEPMGMVAAWDEILATGCNQIGEPLSHAQLATVADLRSRALAIHAPAPVETPADPTAAILARLDALEAALATLPAQSARAPIVEMRVKRTSAHERAVRRAWAERRARRSAELDAAAHDGIAVALSQQLHDALARAEQAEGRLTHAEQQLASTRTNMEKWADEARKGRRSTSRRRLAAQRARRMLEAARQAQRVAQGELKRLRADLVDPAQPERLSDVVQLRRERDEARTACAALQQRCERAEAARDTLAEAVESMAGRMAVAEAAVRRLQAA